jgi:hypothetical protein|tara:strand:+ start:168 stop:473 length:306 start_codon:yes stop_codon:yes gene_type:complete
MTKKGPLGKAEKYYVKGHHKTLEAKEIAKELDRPINVVKKHIAEVKVGELESHTAGAQMARQDGVVTMTQSASEMADAAPKKSRAETQRKSCTTGSKRDAT